VDARDADALRDQLLAALSRAFRSYDASGTPVSGAAELDQAPVLGEGQYLDEIRPGETKHYAVRVGPGQRLSGGVTLPLPRELDGDGGLTVQLTDPSGEKVMDDSGLLEFDSLGQFGNVEARGIASEQAAAPGIESDAPPGVWRITLTVDQGSLSPLPIPVELALQVLDPNEVPGLIRDPGPQPGPPEAPQDGSPTPTATPEATPTPEPADDDGGGAAPLLLAAAVGLVAGGIGGFGAMRRRRRP
jgi:Ca-activated chloride channel family protein